MKFNSKLDYSQNLKAWREHHCNSPHTRYSSLNESEKAWLRGLNETLRRLEDKFYPIISTKLKDFHERIADPSDWMTDFNLVFFITYYLRKDDPEYEEDDDNILMEFSHSFFHIDKNDKDWGFGATHVDQAEQGQEFIGECHCYLYHQLYDHCDLDWRDLFRIGSLWVDIKIDEQSGLPDCDLGFIQYEQKT